MIKLPNFLDRSATIALAIYLLAALGAMLLATQSFAADQHVTRPHCWEESHDGVVERHCEVERPPPPVIQEPDHPRERPQATPRSRSALATVTPDEPAPIMQTSGRG
jgi:hypothetical protein